MTNPLELLKKQLEYTLSRTHTSEDYVEALRDAINACNLGSVAALEQWMQSWVTPKYLEYKSGDPYVKGVEFVKQEWYKIVGMF
jgi:hypothetical protein